MYQGKLNRWLPAVMLATAAGWSGGRLIAQDARPALGSPRSEQVVVEIGPDIREELRAMKTQLEELRRSDAEKTKKIEELQRRVEQQSGVKQTGVVELGLPIPQQPSQQEKREDPKLALDNAVRELERKQQESPLDRAVQGLPSGPASQAASSMSPLGGGMQFQLIDISMDGLFAAGASTERDESLQSLQGGGHDPRKRGFTVQNVELSLIGAVDPYLDGEAHIIYFLDPIEGETVVELEECFFTTRALPHGFQLEVGTFFTEFGRINPNHPHAWHWQDQPIINSRLFGPDGIRGPGFRLGWLLPFDWFSQIHIGVQNANGETMASFLANDEFFTERPIGGRPFVERDVRALDDMLYLARWENSWSVCDDQVTWLVGVSSLFGPNATGRDGVTEIYGLDVTRKWRPAQNQRGWPFLHWESEFMYREYTADNFTDLGDPADPLDDVILSGTDLRDWGFYSQLLCGCKPRWAVGLRYEYVNGAGDSVDEDFNESGRNSDPFRDNRHRLSPLVAFYPTEFSRFRFQYNFDHAEHIDGKDAHSFWLGAEFLFGSHPAHKF